MWCQLKSGSSASICECQVRGLLTVSDRPSNRRLLGETGRVPKVQLKAPHTVRSKHICQMVKKVYIILSAFSAIWLSFRDIDGSALTHFYKFPLTLQHLSEPDRGKEVLRYHYT